MLAQNNTSSGMNVRLYANPGPPFYENEIYKLFVNAKITSSEPLSNITVDVLLGMDELVPPERESSSYYNVSIGDGVLYGWLHASFLNITPALSNHQLLGRLTYGNETVNLTYEMDVVPARTILEAHLLVPPNHTGYDELNWTDVQVLLVNKGGAGTTNLIVDLRYAGRVSSTHHVNVVPPRGNTIIVAALMPLFGQEVLEVHLVVGPGAPRTLANLTLEVVPRPVLDVMWVKAAPGEIVSGEKVHIEALVSNVGNATTTGQQVELMVDGSVVANASMDDLGPGNETVVSTDWTLTGKGTHTVAARAEGDELSARPASVEVKEKTPGVGAWVVLLALLVVSLVARRSPSDGRA